MNYLSIKDRINMKPYRCLLMVIVLSLFGGCVCELSTVKDEIKSTTSTQATTAFSHKKASVKLLDSTVAPSSATLTTKGNRKTTIVSMASESPTARHSATKVYASTKAVVKSARRQKLNSSSSGVASLLHSGLQERLAGLDCNLPVLPSASRLWRGNETHELNLPVKECAGGGGAGADEDCAPNIVSWEGSTDIQSGDILIVRVADSLLLDTSIQLDINNSSESNSSRDGKRVHHLVQPAVYQVTRQGHEHCDVSDGMLLDITPLDEHGAKLFTLYDKDLTEGVNLLIVVSENWGSKCVRLKVTVKSDNCGDYQDCSGKGVCYTNVSMEGYECQCCPGSMGPHCEERDPCYPSPCLNNGTCVELPRPVNGDNYRCLCPYGNVGKNCEKDPCSLAPCMNGGSCMSISINGTSSFHCACGQGWAGARCELSIAAGACASNPCEKGICIEQQDEEIEGKEYRCFCEPGYTGERCELEYNECESSPCEHGGTCSDRVAGFECACTRGYTGNTCQLKVDLCSPNPCSERQFCVDRGNNYDCQCPHGYVGEECHIPSRSACDTSPCAHGGTCWSDMDSFYCSCRPGYTGKLCEEDFILESVVGGETGMEERRGGGSVREMRLPLGLYHDRLHNVYIAAGTLGAAIAIVGVVVTACHCRVNKTYSRLLSRLSRVTEAGPPHHWLQDKRAPPSTAPFPLPSATLDTTDMYYTLDFSDSQSSPLIQ
ncbi:delta and Notch-like epidermal growth factor-related receptor isoform X2 [Plodia interpunctella]|uniref:delta and Notch-like epidermal growth factor-related receptor isoform X2 n=1 Tax=Plodia interpunctella TaxID=58824 RepID=UPI0023681175|nr:delta and Notch-like epidermal growth factor-related receptor isoform X2 [Plodia interpunctella]